MNERDALTGIDDEPADLLGDQEHPRRQHADGPPADDENGAGVMRMDMLPGSGVEAGEAPAKQSRVSRQTVLMILVFAAAGGALFAMRHLAMGPQSSVAEVQIDYDLHAAPAPVSGARHRRILDDLSTTGAEVQVPPDLVQKNPFKIAESLTRPEPVRDTGPGDADRRAREEAERLRREQERRQREIESALASLNVQSVVGGPVPVARISGRTVRIGDVVEGIFTVVGIEGRSVTIEADGKLYTISMQAGGASPPRRRR